MSCVLHCALCVQDWCISRGFTQLSPYAGTGGRGEAAVRAGAGTGQEAELEEGSGDTSYQYDYEEY